MVEVTDIETEQQYAYACFRGQSPDEKIYLIDVRVKFDDEGVVVDVFNGNGLDAIISGQQFYEDLTGRFGE